jgi:hypothetical protein
MQAHEEGASQRSSKSNTSQGPVEPTKIHSLKSGCFFPFLDELTQRIDLPYAPYALVLLWILFQNVVVSLWISGNSVVADYRPLERLCRGFFMITTFTTFGSSPDGLLPVFVVCAAVIVVTVVFIAAVLASFMSKRRFVTVSLYVARILIELVPIFLTFPTASVCGQSLCDALSGGPSIGFVFFGVSLVVLIGYLVIINVTFSFLGHSAYLTMSPFAFFDPSPFQRHLTVNTFFFAFSLLGAYFPGWFVWILIIGHLVYCGVAFVGFLYRPFVEHWLNILMASVCVYTAILDIAILIFQIATIKFPVIIIVLIFLLMPAAFLIARTGDNAISKRVEAKLTSEIEELDLCTKSNTAVFYINYAVAHRLMGLCDGSFAKTVAQVFNMGSVTCHCTRVLSWLPCNAVPFAFLCARATRRRDLGLPDLFLVFQLEHIRLLRESSSSSKAIETLRSITLMVSDTIHQMRSFWERPDCDFSFLYHISSRLSAADSLCNEAISDFPNSIRFRNIYITYLIEAAARYSDAVFQKSRLEMIENGFNFRVDACFRRFVRKFPEYLKLHVVDTRGNLTKMTSGSQASISSSLGSEVLDAGVEEGIGRQILLDAGVRLTVERAFDHRRASAFRLVIFATMFAVIASVVSYLGVLLYFLSYFGSRGATAQRGSFLNYARVNFIGSLISWVYFWGLNSSTVRYEEVVMPLVELDREAGREEH